MKLLIIFNLVCVSCCSYLCLTNYFDLKKIKKESLKNNKIIDYDIWGDLYD